MAVIAVIGCGEIGRIHHAFIKYDVDIVNIDGVEISKEDFYEDFKYYVEDDYNEHDMLISIKEHIDPYDSHRFVLKCKCNHCDNSEYVVSIIARVRSPTHNV